MNLFSLIFRRHDKEHQLSTLARQLSDACLSDVWDRVRDHVFAMDLAEARGYIRARAMAPVRHRLLAVARGSAPLSAELRTRVSARATDRLVQRILCDLAAGSSFGRRAA